MRSGTSTVTSQSKRFTKGPFRDGSRQATSGGLPWDQGGTFTPIFCSIGERLRGIYLGRCAGCRGRQLAGTIRKRKIKRKSKIRKRIKSKSKRKSRV
jgi:hypothetical protein